MQTKYKLLKMKDKIHGDKFIFSYNGEFYEFDRSQDDKCIGYYMETLGLDFYSFYADIQCDDEYDKYFSTNQ